MMVTKGSPKARRRRWLAQPAPGASRPVAAQSGPEQAKKGDPSVNAPARPIDTKQLNETVKEEVKGGESSEGPSPFAYLWAASNPAVDSRRAFGRQGPDRFAAAHSEDLRSGGEPDYQGEIRAGAPALLRPASLARRYGELCDLPQPRQGMDRRNARLDRDCRPDRRPERPLGDQHRLRKDDVLGRTRTRHSRAKHRGRSRTRSRWENRITSKSSNVWRRSPGYTEQFEKVFGTPVTLDGMAKAIATFERVAALSGNSTYDKYNAGDNKALSDSEKRGLVLFGLTLNTDDDFKTDAVRQKAKCTLCHQGFNFTDEQFHNLGIGFDEKTGKFADLGRWAIDPIGAKLDADIGAFKTPTVREVAHTGPYMHDGSLTHARAGR